MAKETEIYKTLLEIKETMGKHTAKLESIEVYIKQHDIDIKELKDFKTGVKAKVGLVASCFGFISAIATQVAIKMFIHSK